MTLAGLEGGKPHVRILQHSGIDDCVVYPLEVFFRCQ